jgi:peptidoglycan hydrolase-like protein with peptidoglycan-binding domain
MILLVLVALIAAACGDDGADLAPTTEASAETTSASGATSTTAAAATTEGEAPAGPVFITKGDTGAYVYALQYLLDCAGYGPLEVDGMYGDITAGAVEAAQEAHAREVTGEPDEAMFAELSRACDRQQIVYFPAGSTSVGLAGNVTEGDYDEYVLGILEAQLLTIEIGEPVSVSVQGRDGMVIYGPATEAKAEIVIPRSQDYSIFVQAEQPTSYLMMIDIPPREDGTETTVVAAEFDPADWIGADWPDGETPGGLEVFATSACPELAADPGPWCEDWSVWIVGGPDSLVWYEIDDPGDPIQVMAWLVHIVRDGDGMLVRRDIVDAIVIDATRGDTAFGTCSDADSTQSFAVIGPFSLQSSPIKVAIGYSVDAQELRVDTETNVGCVDGVGDTIAHTP